MFRLRDFLLSIFLLLILSWLFLIISILLAISQKRIFFIQKRTGFQMKPFHLIKFSTLRDIHGKEREEDSQLNRLTAAGKILRKLSLDELPQLINILKGEMSFVGPRPLLSEYDTLYSEEQKTRFQVLPGITGWAQVNGRNRISWKEKFELDVWYVNHQSWMLDMKIFWKTAVHFFSAKDVYADESTTAYKFDGTN